MGAHGWDMAYMYMYGHIKTFGVFPFPHQRKICTEGLQGQHAFSMLGGTMH